MGPLTVGAIGIGSTAVSGWYGPADESEAISVFRRAPEVGVTMIDTADVYSRGPVSSEEVIGRALLGIRDEVVLTTKGGLIMDDISTYGLKTNGSPAYLKAAIEQSLRRLQTDRIDMYYLHRIDPEVPVEDSIGALAEEVQRGTILNIGISEVDLAVLDKVQAIHPIHSVESELSMWARDALLDIVPWCERNDAAFVPYAPLGRGFLAGAVTSDTTFKDGDIRTLIPRFQAEALSVNQIYVHTIRAIADAHDATMAQVALAWLLAQSPTIVPIPGMEKIQYLEENAAAAWLELSPTELEVLNALPSPEGDRFAGEHGKLTVSSDAE